MAAQINIIVDAAIKISSSALVIVTVPQVNQKGKKVFHFKSSKVEGSVDISMMLIFYIVNIFLMI